MIFLLSALRLSLFFCLCYFPLLLASQNTSLVVQSQDGSRKINFENLVKSFSFPRCTIHSEQSAVCAAFAVFRAELISQHPFPLCLPDSEVPPLLTRAKNKVLEALHDEEQSLLLLSELEPTMNSTSIALVEANTQCLVAMATRERTRIVAALAIVCHTTLEAEATWLAALTGPGRLEAALQAVVRTHTAAYTPDTHETALAHAWPPDRWLRAADDNEPSFELANQCIGTVRILLEQRQVTALVAAALFLLLVIPIVTIVTCFLI
eukprot:m.82858 g.82858  ORF g.82858 m.82858 type:complete len:265 (+) comp13420_c0_seq3:26-820(+)